MQYSAELDELIALARKALDRAEDEAQTREAFDMSTWGDGQDCGTVACMCGWMGAISGEHSVAIAMRFDDAFREMRSTPAYGSQVQAHRVTYGGGRVFSQEYARVVVGVDGCYVPDSPKRVRRLTQFEQIERQRGVLDFWQRRNRALWVHETRANLPKRERRAFDMEQKAA